MHLRSSQDSDGGDPVETVAAHQVGNVVLDLHLLPGESSALKQLSPGCIVVLGNVATRLPTWCRCRGGAIAVATGSPV